MIHMGKPNVLIIDDEHETADILKKYIESHGYKTFVAYDGKEGLEILENNSVGVIFCDICMPRMDGIEFLEKLRETNIIAQIIMITGHNSLSRCVISVENDVCNYLIKPVSRETILESIQRAERNLDEKYDMMMRSANLKELNSKKEK